MATGTGFTDYFVEPCKTSWWATLLYVNNYVYKDYQCIPHAWYLMIDTQLFVLTPIFLIPMRKYKKYTLMALGATVVAGLISPFVLSYTMKLDEGNRTSTDYRDKYFMNTYARFGTYVMGMVLGYIIFECRTRRLNTIELKRCIVLWLIAIAGIIACTYSPHEVIVTVEYNRLGHSFYLAFARPAWCLFLGLTVFLCETGNGAVINWLLSLPVFQVLGKLSYSMYLVHFFVILLRNMSLKTIVELSHFQLMFNFWGDFAITVSLSVLLCLGFESPIVHLSKQFLKKPPRKTVERSSKDESPI